MKHMHYTEIEEEIPTEEGVKGMTVRWLISEKDGAENFAMRVFTIQPGGYSPHHQHDWEHEVFILEGNGILRSGDRKEPLKPGDFIFIKPGELHQIRNESDKIARFMCLIPSKGKC
ncbi:MAG: cupin domain-containing protein [Euryarchaeota archaeon]|nr:cupin domain-containing protein [Euryarchaeota archaeon]MBU4032973.1 cupin domain-containing protein [Candidatus Thermoplasmatota archaeon]MBU4070550.1 cupin domain-containing protein [Candidatus Thermoplasmatota archaeon]MBU4145110.1 cupin domain-containing protein [Candidatus Thermoplasmatota archaeon]